MQMRRHMAAWGLGLLTVACSGRYEGGGIEPVGEGGSAGSAAVATAGSSSVGGGAGGQITECTAKEGVVVPLEGPFAPPSVVWGRIAPLIWGREAAPPSALPAQTTYEWAGELAGRGLAQAAAAHEVASSEEAVPGVHGFLRRLLHLGDEAALAGNWNALLSSREPALQVLLFQPLEPGARRGIFTERAWLQAHGGISIRGYVMLEALFGVAVPPEPGGIAPLVAMGGKTRRQVLAEVVQNSACAACHSLFDPLGFSLEHFDVNGEYRALDAGLPVDSSGTYRYFPEGSETTFTDHLDLAAQLVDRCEVKRGFADTFLRIALEEAGTPPEARLPAFEANRERIEQAFLQGGLTYASLVRAFAQSPAVLRP